MVLDPSGTRDRGGGGEFGVSAQHAATPSPTIEEAAPPVEESFAALSARVRAAFPYLERTARCDRPPVFLDSAASAQKARIGLDAMTSLGAHHYANVHRGAYRLSAESTGAYEGARRSCARFVGTKDPREIVFVRGTTEAINLVANTFGESLEPGDEIILTEIEHHANLVPWQMLAKRRNLRLRFLRMTAEARIDPADLEPLINARTRLFAAAHVSNAFGTRLPLEALIATAHAHGIPVLIDGAQAAPHIALDLPALGADFYAFSGHKIYGPTGIGVLWAPRARLETLPPWQGGGEMITEVLLEESRYRGVPYRFEAGTPPILEAAGLAAVMDWLATLPLARLRQHGHTLLERAHRGLASIPQVRIFGPPPAEKEPVLSFDLAGVHPHDLATFLDEADISVRTGHHCAQPALRALGVEATARVSFGIYNTAEEVDIFLARVEEAVSFFGSARA